MIQLEQLLNKEVQIQPANEEIRKQVKANWDSVAKPLDSMGHFETFLSGIGGIQESLKPDLSKARILVMCADNGIVEEGISQSDQSITAICAVNIAAGRSCLGIMAAREGIEILATDVGVNTTQELALVCNRKVRPGTRNFRKEPAMTYEETVKAIQVGMDLVWESRQQGYGLVGTGEMGIGNTTTSSAIAASLLGKKAAEVTGRGAGLSDEGLLRKIRVIDEAISKYRLYEKEPLEVLRTVGGFDIAALTGVCIGGAFYHVPVVLDGFISMVAALTACRLFPETAEFLIPSHSSKEPAVCQIREELKLTPVIDAGMALGEGTGAVLMISLLKTANEVYEKSCSFDGAGIEQYQRFEKKSE